MLGLGDEERIVQQVERLGGEGGGVPLTRHADGIRQVKRREFGRHGIAQHQ